MAAPTTQYIPLLIFVPLIVWRLYSRIRRSIGRQALSKWRPWVKFEQTPEGLFYTPNAHIGMSSPLTLAIFGLLAGYYVTYAVGLLRWRRHVEASRA